MEIGVYLSDSIRLPGQSIHGIITLIPHIHTHGNQSSAVAISNRDTNSNPSVPSDTDSDSDTESDNHDINTKLTNDTTTNIHTFNPSDYLDDIKIQFLGRCIFDKNRWNLQKIQKYLNESSNTSNTSSSPSTSSTTIQQLADGNYNFKLFDSKPIRIPLEASESNKHNTVAPASTMLSPPTHPYSYEFHATLPSSLPPTYKGSTLRYIYFLILATFKEGTKLNEIKIPIHIRMSSLLTSHNIHTTTPYIHQPVNRWCKLQCINMISSSMSMNQQQQQYGGRQSSLTSTSSIHRATSYNNNSTSPSETHTSQPPTIIYDDTFQPIVYNVSQTLKHSHDEQHIVRLTLSKQYYRIGDSIRGHLDFSDATLQCYRLVILLEHIETMNEKYMNASLVSSSASENDKSSSTYISRRVTHWSCHQYTRNIKYSDFLFTLPSASSDMNHNTLYNFSTDFMTSQWTLTFKFIVSTALLDNATSIQEPAVDRLIWSLPLHLLGNTHLKPVQSFHTLMVDEA